MIRLLPILFALAACADSPPDYDPACMEPILDPIPFDPEGTLTHWRVDTVQFPDSATEAVQLALNLDCDQQARSDNALGQILSTLYSQSYEPTNLDAEVEAMIDAGRLTHLLSIRSTGTVDADGVGLTLRHGTGDEPYAIDTERGSGDLTGTLTGGLLELHGGQLPIGLVLPGLDEVVIAPIEGARLEARMEADHIEGRIAGAIPAEAFDLIVLPFAHRALTRAIERDCPDLVAGEPPCTCTAQSLGGQLLGWFDEQPDRPGIEPDGDCVLTLDELRHSSLISSLLAPDVDMFDADGELNPRADGEKDSLSIGLGFTAVPAAIQP